MQNSGDQTRSPSRPTRGSWQRTCVGGVGWRGGGSLAPKKLSDGRELYSAPPLTTPGFPLQVLLPSLRCTWAVGCTPLQARAYFCAHPQAAIGEPTAIRSPHTSSASAHTCTAPSAQPRLSANTSTVVHACTGARPSGRALLKPGEVRANSHRPRRSSAEAPRARSRSAPWCSSRALLPVLPLPLSLSLFPQIFLPLFLRSSLPSPWPTEPRSPAGTYL